MMTEQKKYRRLVDNLSSLGLKGMEINLDEYLEQIGNKEKSVIEALCELTDIEMKLKTDRAIHGCVKVANFPFLKEMKDFDFSFQPSINEGQIRGFENLKFLEQKQNILLSAHQEWENPPVSVYRNRSSEKQKIDVFHQL